MIKIKIDNKDACLYYVSLDKRYCIVSYSEEGINLFKIDMQDIIVDPNELEAFYKECHQREYL